MRKVIIGNITCEVPTSHKFIWVDWYDDQPPEVITSDTDNVFISQGMNGEVCVSYTLDFYSADDLMECSIYMGLDARSAIDYRGKLFEILDDGELGLIAIYSPV